MDTTGDDTFDRRDSTDTKRATGLVVAVGPPNAAASEAPRRRLGARRATLWGAAAAALMAAVALTVSFEPDTFDVSANAAAVAGRPVEEMAPGTHTATALVGVLDRILHKTGGYLQNDVAPPFALLDNIPAWERGAITEVRDTVRALRDDFARQQTQSAEDPDLVRADAQLHFDATNWILPATENEFAKGREALTGYVARLQAGGSTRAQFEVRADNLNFYLATVEKRLGAYAQRLAGSVGEWRLPGWLGGSAAPANPAYVPWVEVDDVFFEARGYTWALLHTLRGIEHDFHDLLEAKAAAGSLARIIEKLEQTQAPVLSPVILNNSGFGVFTNHSLVMTSYISRANAAIIDFRQLLSEG